MVLEVCRKWLVAGGGAELWKCRCLCILELAVAGGCNAISGGPLVEWVGSVAPEEECVGSYNGKAHPCENETSHV